MKYGVRVKDIMSKKLVRVSLNANIVTAAEMMRNKKVGALEVCDKGILVGIVTDGDIIRKVVAGGLSPSKIKISQIMTLNPVTVFPDDDLYKVSKLMNEKGIKRVIVMENEKMIGYLSQRDLLKIQPGLLDVLIEKLRIAQPSYRLDYKREKNNG